MLRSGLGSGLGQKQNHDSRHFEIMKMSRKKHKQLNDTTFSFGQESFRHLLFQYGTCPKLSKRPGS